MTYVCSKGQRRDGCVPVPNLKGLWLNDSLNSPKDQILEISFFLFSLIRPYSREIKDGESKSMPSTEDDYHFFNSLQIYFRASLILTVIIIYKKGD